MTGLPEGYAVRAPRHEDAGEVAAMIHASDLADNGATVAELEAIFGWTGGTMASLYTRKADRKRLATGAMHLLGNSGGTSSPAPLHPVRAGKAKSE